ncbi:MULTISPECIES: hypothetical protein [Streptomycetaceae]|uniref:Uncharacterized protein n=1 Tax=Streptantibioticus cattleyicolor (strain ATCC 35852 / DSM 46488 / JCM 4925 / NBRC 14057 / NRRL 8057) TaxID=1003195 RepID=F8K1Q4_STREN|nr:hypothetical protein [Streptantibioticus cattleyicolor]AEW95333.1 hypothetical protein SCATT_29620 [Streptantibioticus cattleyicolor NRRL 8057 = DSM 46488]MYS59910.1 hypothetical protein [Streptomyces sp. SID5468]CCB75676.1 conserved exported protein of unknown function [Streptantibioticus cattleyicolor NRRL 8057 = DSM 46488]
MSAALLAWLALFGGTGSGGGYLASGADGPTGPRHLVPPDAKVSFVPLPGSSGPARGAPDPPAAAPSASGPAASRIAPSTSPPATPTPTPSTGEPANPGPVPVPPGPPDSGQPPSARPARLTMDDPVRAPGDQRWCDEVTVVFTDTGDLPVTSGTVTFATHVIGLLGTDWATVTTTRPVPVPIAGGRSVRRAYQVCVDAWRVPLGMHVETRSVRLGGADGSGSEREVRDDRDDDHGEHDADDQAGARAA